MTTYSFTYLLFFGILLFKLTENTLHMLVHTHKRTFKVSANPTTYMATATALATAKIKPIDPPNSGPRLRDIM